MKSGFAYAAAISSCALYCLNGGSDGALSRWAPLVASCQCVLKELGELLLNGSRRWRHFSALLLDIMLRPF